MTSTLTKSAHPHINPSPNTKNLCDMGQVSMSHISIEAESDEISKPFHYDVELLGKNKGKLLSFNKSSSWHIQTFHGLIGKVKLLFRQIGFYSSTHLQTIAINARGTQHLSRDLELHIQDKWEKKRGKPNSICINAWIENTSISISSTVNATLKDHSAIILYRAYAPPADESLQKDYNEFLPTSMLYEINELKKNTKSHDLTTSIFQQIALLINNSKDETDLQIDESLKIANIKPNLYIKFSSADLKNETDLPLFEYVFEKIKNFILSDSDPFLSVQFLFPETLHNEMDQIWQKLKNEHPVLLSRRHRLGFQQNESASALTN